MSTNPNEVLVKRSDLPPVTDEGSHYVVDSVRYYKIDEIETLRSAALRLLAVATLMEDTAKREAAQKAEEWELEYAVPLARTMYNTFYNFSSNYRKDLAEYDWLRHYEDRNPTTMAWVATASTILKAQEDTDAD